MPNIYADPIHLGLGAVARVQTPITGMEWYAEYSERVAGDGAEGRLVAAHRFTESWGMWEMHPAGDEVVVCLDGKMTLHQLMADGTTTTVTLGPGDFVINPPGCWHTADVTGEASALFITAGLGTEHRAR